MKLLNIILCSILLMSANAIANSEHICQGHNNCNNNGDIAPSSTNTNSNQNHNSNLNLNETNNRNTNTNTSSSVGIGLGIGGNGGNGGNSTVTNTSNVNPTQNVSVPVSNTNTSHSVSSVSNSGNSSSYTNSNTSSNSTSTSSASNNGSNISMNWEANPRNPVSSAYAPTILGSGGIDTCLGSVSGGAQGVAFGVSLGGTKTDMHCEMLKDVKILRDIGMSPDVIKARLCLDSKLAEAFSNAGQPCNTTKTQPQANKVDWWNPGS